MDTEVFFTERFWPAFQSGQEIKGLIVVGKDLVLGLFNKHSLELVLKPRNKQLAWFLASFVKLVGIISFHGLVLLSLE